MTRIFIVTHCILHIEVAATEREDVNMTQITDLYMHSELYSIVTYNTV
jgi:hypothetical protein